MADVSLRELLDLSIGTPDVGSVNFSALHALLHAILGHLQIERVASGWRGEAGGAVEERLRGVEEQMRALDALRSDAPLSDMWTLMQLRSRTQASEDGVSKCVDLIQDLLKEVQVLKESRDDLRQEVHALNGQLSQLNLNELADHIVGMEQYHHRFEELDNTMKELKDKMAQYPVPEELSQYVTWEMMESALFSDRQKIQETLPAGLQGTISGGKDTVPVHPLNQGSPIKDDRVGSAGVDLSRQVSPHQSDEAVMSRPLSQVSSGAERYPETIEALKEVGKLRDGHKKLEAHVRQLEANKADQSQLQQMRDLLTAMEARQIPDHVPEQLTHMRNVVDSLVAEKEKSVDVASDMEGALHQLQVDCERLHSTSMRMMEEHSEKQIHIDRLYKILEELNEKKADKELVEMQNETKADKWAVESKVSREQFDSMTEQLNNMLQELVRKISGQEKDWNKVIEKISTEMDCKLNRIELDPLKKQLDDRWRNIHKNLQTPQLPEQDDAAGLKKQLVARFHCISCDRPVDMMTPGQHLSTLPSAPGLPSHKSSRPYSVYELEQMRQHCRSERIPEMADYSYLARSCGGSHTLTYPSRRYTRIQHITHLIQSEEESRPVSSGPLPKADETNVMGLDGHVYKGRPNSRAVRLSETRLPTISPREGNWKSKDKVSRSQSQRSSGADAGPGSAKTQRSHSASSISVRDQPQSSTDCLSQDVPLQSSFHDTTTEPNKDLDQSEEEPATSL